MTNTPAQPTAAGVDAVVPFAVEALDVRGRIVNMGPVLNSILARHKYLRRSTSCCQRQLF